MSTLSPPFRAGRHGSSWRWFPADIRITAPDTIIRSSAGKIARRVNKKTHIRRLAAELAKAFFPVGRVGLACVLANVANVASEPGPFHVRVPGARGSRGWFVWLVCLVGPLARWSTGPRQPVSPLAR